MMRCDAESQEGAGGDGGQPSPRGALLKGLKGLASITLDATSTEAQATALLDSIKAGTSDGARFNHVAAWAPLPIAMKGLVGARTTEFWRESIMKPAKT